MIHKSVNADIKRNGNRCAFLKRGHFTVTTIMSTPNRLEKRKALDNITNSTLPAVLYDANDEKRWAKFDETHWFPIQPQQNLDPVPDLPAHFETQNVHPSLALFNPRLQTDTLSHEDMCILLAPGNEMQLVRLYPTADCATKSPCY